MKQRWSVRIHILSELPAAVFDIFCFALFVGGGGGDPAKIKVISLYDHKDSIPPNAAVCKEMLPTC